jgi:hypothetical protein
MNFAFFENLTHEEAGAYLDRFLELGRRARPAFAAAAGRNGVRADGSLESIGELARWVAGTVMTILLEPDPDLPDWIRESESYEANLFGFDEQSKTVLLRMAFYLGEAFVRAYPQLRWAVGQPDTAPQGQPVVTGFSSTLELPALLVTENIIARVIAGGEPDGGAEKAVAYWTASVPR